MKTLIHSWTARSLALGMAFLVATATPTFSQAPNIKPPPKEAPKVPTVPPKVVEQPKVPKVVVPPKVVTPKNVPKIVNVPKTVNVPKVVVAPKIPTIKEPPKVPKIPTIVKVPDAPKVPKTPVVAKFPDAPKVPNTPKIPTIVKVADSPKVPKTPIIAKIPDAPKANGNAGNNGPPAVISSAKTPKTPNTSAVVAKNIAIVPQASGVSTTGNTNNTGKKNGATEATVQEALAIIRGNRPNTDPGGPKSDVPAAKRPSKDLPSVSGSGDDSGNALQDALAIATGKGTDSPSSLLSGTNTNNKAPVDQGFGDKPKTIDSGAGAGLGGNPVNALTGDDQKSGGTGPGGIAGQGTEALSDGGTFSSGGLARTTKDGEVVGSSSKAALDKVKQQTGKSGDEINQFVKNLLGVGAGRNGDGALGTDSEGRAEDTALPVGRRPKEEPATSPSTPATAPVPDDGTTVIVSSNGNVITKKADGTTSVTSADRKTVTTTHPDGSVTETKDGETTTVRNAGRPREDATDPAAFAKFLRDHPALAQQLAVSNSNDRTGQGNVAGNIDHGNADNTTTSGPGNGVAVPDSGTTARNLFGQPGQRGGVGEGGAGNGGGINFNNKKFGAIDLGPDQTVTAGTRKQNEADAAPGSGQPLKDFPPTTATSDNDSGKPLDPSALAKFLRENPAIAEQIIASRSVQVPKAAEKKK